MNPIAGTSAPGTGARIVLLNPNTSSGVTARIDAAARAAAAPGTVLAGIRLLDGAFAAIDHVQSEKEDLLVALAHRAVEEDAADVIILAGAPLAGLAARVADRIPVPVVDGVAAAVKQAEALAALRPRKATAGTFRRPAPKPVTGVAPALERLMAGPSEGSN
jgi:allantoin racemase